MEKESSFWTINTDEITLGLSEIHSNTFVCTVLDGPIIDMDQQKVKDIEIQASFTQQTTDGCTESSSTTKEVDKSLMSTWLQGKRIKITAN